jgi:hypothetical protein
MFQKWTAPVAGFLVIFVPSNTARAEHFYYRHYTKSVRSGAESYIYKADELNSDCTSNDISVSIRDNPRHGTIRVSRGKVMSNYPRNYAQRKCFGMSVDGISVYYEPDHRYTGKDKIVISVEDKRNNVEITTVTINVL